MRNQKMDSFSGIHTYQTGKINMFLSRVTIIVEHNVYIQVRGVL